MKKIYLKLIALSLTLAVSVTMVVAASYAWVVLSSQPEVAGIQVTIGARDTILVAADITETVDGVEYHYPDHFADTMNFGLHDQYQYLKKLGSLMPVSTVDGINWFLPEYYDSTDEEVRGGSVAAGQLKDVRYFTRENDLSHANLQGTKANEDAQAEGHYVYLDFWVVSPGFDCKLRLSVPTVDGDNSGGTFLIEQMEAATENGVTVLKKGNGQAAAMARVGFLANDMMLTDDSMVHYVQSPEFDDRFHSLRGWYSDPGDYAMNFDTQRFTIYEPNADLHPSGAAAKGVYVPTNAIGLDGDTPTALPTTVGKVTAQCASEWLTLADKPDTTVLEEIFQSAVIGKTELDAQEKADYFYNEYLQGQVDHYVSKGKFVKNSTNLSNISLDTVMQEGATQDVYIVELQRNVPQRIRMFVWLEGQDADCVNLTDAATLMLNLELAGSTAEETTG